ncbi:hypothetical protein H5410_052888 [Solanum commersonii]|uniref:Uncharacterized protein n=1 Tax=Solanum commersonii TaxID=4109 RepID=A0A9J5X4D0_SOLCO|nr:hypothetical protein H5410_052888 [Solanum commersonii]
MKYRDVGGADRRWATPLLPMKQIEISDISPARIDKTKIEKSFSSDIMPRVRVTHLLVKPRIHRLVKANRWLLGFGGYFGEFYGAGGSNNGSSTMNNNSQRPYSSLLSDRSSRKTQFDGEAISCGVSTTTTIAVSTTSTLAAAETTAETDDATSTTTA